MGLGRRGGETRGQGDGPSQTVVGFNIHFGGRTHETGRDGLGEEGEAKLSAKSHLCTCKVLRPLNSPHHGEPISTIL